MKCQKCNFEYDEDELKFCPKCGKKLADIKGHNINGKKYKLFVSIVVSFCIIAIILITVNVVLILKLNSKQIIVDSDKANTIETKNLEIKKDESDKQINTNEPSIGINKLEKSEDKLEKNENELESNVILPKEDSFTEDVIGFDVNTFVNKIFPDLQDIQVFLNKYNFKIIRGDQGEFVAEDELETTLHISLTENNDGFVVESFFAEVPSYVIPFTEVKKMCDPNGEGISFDEDSLTYYYFLFIDNVEVRYCYSYDMLRTQNPEVNYITITAR